jgi:peptidoglycan/xylan/chitin deacetylase (PgdA/CDA1 family)
VSLFRLRLLIAVIAAGLAAVFAVTPVTSALAASAPGNEGPAGPPALMPNGRAAIAPAVTGPQVSTECPAAPYGTFSSAPGAGKTVALTFDDGPGASTASILSILNSYGVPATFFNIGQNMAARPALVQQEAARGYMLGNHTWDHPNMTTLSASAQGTEMDQASAEQVNLTGVQPCTFRPPGGSYNASTLSQAQQRRMKVWLWSVDTLDWQANGSSSSYWVNRIISLAESGGGAQQHPVVLMHNQPAGNPATVLALPTIINFFRDRGYTFVDLAGRTGLRGGVLGDVTGDGTPDVVAIDPAGNLYVYPNTGGTGTSTFGARSQVGSGWRSYSLAAVTELDGSGRAGILAIGPTGNLLYYPNAGGGGTSTFGTPSQVGTGWGGYTIAGLADLDGSGNAGIVAISPSGTLLYYPNTGGGAFAAPSVVGSGWTGYTVDAADINGDGAPDLLAVDSSGNMYVYPNTGGATFGARSQVGSGWTGWRAMDAGFLTGADGADILAIDPSGNLYLYPNTGGTGTSTFGARSQVGSGWSGYIIN